MHHVRGAVPRRGAVVVEPLGAVARRRLRAGEPRLAVRQGPLRHRVGALRAAHPRTDGARGRASSPRCRGPTRSTPPRRRSSGCSTCTDPARSPCSAARAEPTRTRTRGRGSPRASSAPTTSTRSSATACPPRSCSVSQRAEIADVDTRGRDRAARSGPARRAPGPVPAHQARPRSSSVSRSSISRRSSTACRSTRAAAARPAAGRGDRCRRARADRARRGANAPDRSSSCRPHLARRIDERDHCESAGGASRTSPMSASCRHCAAANVHGALGAGLVPGFLPGHVDARRRRASGSPSTGASTPAGAGSTRRRSSAAAPTARSRCSCCSARSAVRLPGFRSRAARRRRRRLRHRGRRASCPTRRARAMCSCPARSGARRPARSPTSRTACSGVGRKVAPEGTAMDDWRIAVELAFRLGRDFDLATVDEVTDEIVLRSASAATRRSCPSRFGARRCGDRRRLGRHQEHRQARHLRRQSGAPASRPAQLARLRRLSGARGCRRTVRASRAL